MGGRVFAKFHVDAGIGDVIMQPVERVQCADWLDFAGIPTPEVRMIAREQQFAEKVHAYTLPRNSPNSRVKDLVDVALLIGDGLLDQHKAAQALRLTFEKRHTHVLPVTLASPPQDWQKPFEVLAEECGLPVNIDAVFESVRAFYLRILAGTTEE